MYGVPCGSKNYVGHQLDLKVEEIARGAATACRVLKGESQSLWAVLRLSLQQQFGYWLSLVHPSQVAAAAARVDTVLQGVLQEVGGVNIPLGGEGLSYTCPMGPEVPHLEGRSFQSMLSGLPSSTED